MRINLKDQLLNLISNAYPKPVSGTDCEIFAGTVGHKPSNGAREARRLAEAGKVRSGTNARGCVEYTLIYDPATCCQSIKLTNPPVHSQMCPSRRVSMGNTLL